MEFRGLWDKLHNPDLKLPRPNGRYIVQYSETVKELLKLVEQIEKLMIRIISLIGWILIIILLLK